MQPRSSPIPPTCTACLAAFALAASVVAQQEAPPAADRPLGPVAESLARTNKLDRFRVKIAPASSGEVQGPSDTTSLSDSTSASPEPTAAKLSGRLILFFTPDNPRWSDVRPIDAPFFEKLQPIAAITLDDIASDAVIEIDPLKAQAFGGALSDLDGLYRVQALLDTNGLSRGHVAAGNLMSEVVTVDLSPDRVDEPELELTATIPESPLPSAPGVIWVERESALLSAHFGRRTTLRAGVVLPYGYDDLAFDRRFWPAIYVFPGFGGTRLTAAEVAEALRDPDARGAIPQAVWIHLDAESAWGHHGFCDSEANGPIGRALVEEFVPFLEERFRLVAKPEARLLTGHSSGGWTALHLALTAPETFGACFASAPDPVDFSRFQKTDLYRDPNLFTLADGRETPSYRGPLGPQEDRVFLTVGDEYATEQVLDPNGRSGQQWSAWEAMWSPIDPARNAPRRICNPETGAIDPVTVEAWSRHDIARRIDADPDRLARILAERVRLVVGSRDSFYLNESVVRLRARLDGWRADAVARGRALPTGPGFIEVLDGLTHGTVYPVAQLRFHRAMQEHLRAHGLADPPLREGARIDPVWTDGKPAPDRDATPRLRP